MKIKVLGSYGSEGPGQRPSALLVDDRVLVDAGTVGGALSPAEQIEVEYALVSHAHFDHIAGLCFLTDTLAMLAPNRRITACSLGPVLDSLRTHVFNDIVWPNFASIPNPKNPVLGFRALAEEGEARVGELWVTPIPVEHTILTTGFIVHDGETGFVFSGDTGPTKKIWQAAKEMRGLKAVIVESFERIHRSNLVGMGVLPLEYLEGQSLNKVRMPSAVTGCVSQILTVFTS
jgi:glyoxylase-like metal-dependent hydrolase (beta-lactamase superfamily II)